MLDELTDMLVERLQVYERKNKVLPDRIFVYRDGVSEVSNPFSFCGCFVNEGLLWYDQGQFDIVIVEELPQILNAFKKLNTKDRKKAYRPHLSIIICGWVFLVVSKPLVYNLFYIGNDITRSEFSNN